MVQTQNIFIIEDNTRPDNINYAPKIHLIYYRDILPGSGTTETIASRKINQLILQIRLRKGEL
jgi:hypothetical protein